MIGGSQQGVGDSGASCPQPQALSPKPSPRPVRRQTVAHLSPRAARRAEAGSTPATPGATCDCGLLDCRICGSGTAVAVRAAAYTATGLAAIIGATLYYITH